MVDCAHALFEAQVERTPDVRAVAGTGEPLTYRELNERANQLAHHLLALGVGPDVLVGVYLPRVPELLIAVLGVLKAGGAYLPLDPDYPAARLAFMLQDAACPVLLTDRGLHDRLPAHEAKVVVMDRLPRDDRGRANPPHRTGAAGLAYLMYTSGSTGRPKGILVPHRGLVNYLTWCLTAYPATSGSGAPVHSSLAFDLTVTSLFVPLLAGGTVHLLPPGNPIERLREAFVGGSNFSLVKITPAHLELLGQVLQPAEAVGRTRAFIIGGENLTERHIAFWQAACPDTLLVNEYGPTETVVGCCVYFVPRGRAPAGSVPIGQPIANTHLHVLDADGQPVPPGVAGELYIGGAGVARGYHNRPELTAASFVPDPFGTEAGARLYRTGDLVRARPDGNLEFLGRLDGQVKVRGCRVEVAEIEATLQEHPAVRRALVVAHADSAGDTRLTGYYVPQSEPWPPPDDLRAFLRQRLPSYMVPAELVALAALPLTLNGKVDRQTLPRPTRDVADGAQTAFGSADEIRMAGLWEEVLGVRPLSSQSHFFELGGDSLQVVRLLQRIRTVFGRELRLASLLQAPTVTEMVRQIGAPRPPGAASLVPLRTGGTRPPFFCLPGAGADVLGLTELAELLGPDQPVYGIQVHLPEESEPSPRSLEELAARCIALVRAAQPEGPYFLGGFSFGATLAFEAARQLTAQGEKLGALIVLDQLACSRQKGRRTRASWVEIVKDLPRWTRHDLTRISPAFLIVRLTRWANYGLRALRKLPELTDPSPPADAPAKLMDYQLVLQQEYAPGPYPGRVILLKAEAQPARPLLQALLTGRDLGWSRLADGGVEVSLVPGWHLSILKQPAVAVLAAHVRRCLERAQVALSPGSPVPQASPATPLPTPATASATATWQVVANAEGQYSLWPDPQPRPAGWHDAGPRGTRAACLAYIRDTWTDLRPRPIRPEPTPDLAPPILLIPEGSQK